MLATMKVDWEPLASPDQIAIKKVPCCGGLTKESLSINCFGLEG